MKNPPKNEEIDSLIVVPFVKFEFLFPTTYKDPFTGQQKFIQITEITHQLIEFTRKYEEYSGYTISNPFAPPPFAGEDIEGLQERTFWAMILIPDYKLNEVLEDIKKLVELFQQKFQQREILTYYHSVYRLLPQPPLNK